ncbi:MAG: esterase [Flavobacteriales bacterium]|nr:esterase [Flavobacteriales bacterium]
MKLKIHLIALFTICYLQINAQSIASVETKKIQSKFLKQEREILIYTPVDYDWRVNEYFDVIFVFDSQNREFFDYTTSIISFLPNNGKSFIVIGITSPFNEELNYGRNNDLLPVLTTEDSKKRFGTYSGNADNFLEFISNEVESYVNNNYRTLNTKIAVGHSLSASFLLYSIIKKPNLFSNYIAISPNLAYENEFLTQSLISFDYTKIKNKTFLYLSNADEGIEYWKEWKPAREKLYNFFDNKLKNENITIKINNDPTKNHLSTFPPSLNDAFEFYFKNSTQINEEQTSSQLFETKIRLKVQNKTDTIYITGNQKNLGNWNPEKIKMKEISEFEREIVLELQSPAQLKFTKGTWDSELEIIGTYDKITIKPEIKQVHEFKTAENQ